MIKAKILTDKACYELLDTVEDNLESYVEGEFAHVLEARQNTTHLEQSLDMEKLADLIPSIGTETEAKNSILVYEALPDLTPRLAREEGLWTYLTHGPCLSFSRERWLTNISKDKLLGSIKSHFFANTLTRCRDDNALSRFWWNGYVASIASPDSMEYGLSRILATADIRSNFIERPQITSWPNVCRGILRHMQKNSWIVDAEINFREFMIAVNFRCGGILLEGICNSQIDNLMASCTEQAKTAVNSKKNKAKKK